MISRTTFCSAQAPVMRFARTRPIPVTSRSRSGSASMTSNTCSPKARTSFLRVDRTDAADHPGPEVLLDPVDRGRRRRAQEVRLELLAMGAVVDPFTGGRHPLARRDHRGVADDRDQVAVAARLVRRTQKPLSALWKVTRSTRPASTSWVDGSCCGLICVATVGASPPNRIWRPALRSRSSSATRAPRVLSIGDRSLVGNRPAI